MNFFLFCHDWKNNYEHIFWYISFYDYLNIRNLVSKDQSKSKCFLKSIKSFTACKVIIYQVYLSGKYISMVILPY